MFAMNLNGCSHFGSYLFEGHLDEVNWYWLSGNPSIPLEFFEKHLDKVDWQGLSWNPSIPPEFFEKYLGKR
jgi:hypothetical protein